MNEEMKQHVCKELLLPLHQPIAYMDEVVALLTMTVNKKQTVKQVVRELLQDETLREAVEQLIETIFLTKLKESS